MRTGWLAVCALSAFGCSGCAAHARGAEEVTNANVAGDSADLELRPRPTVVVPSATESLAAAPALTGVEERTPRDEGLPSHAEIDLRERVQRALLAADSLSYTAKHARVEVDERDVRLFGEVRTSQEKLTLGEVVRDVAGVQRVDNRVVVINRTPQANRMPER